MLHAGMGHMALPCCHKKSIQLSPANPFSNSRSLFLIFANWRLRGVLDRDNNYSNNNNKHFHNTKTNMISNNNNNSNNDNTKISKMDNNSY